jgi:hypothetical protein
LSCTEYQQTLERFRALKVIPFLKYFSRSQIIGCTVTTTNYRYYLQGRIPRKRGFWVVPKRRQGITTIRCLISQKKADLNCYTVSTAGFLANVCSQVHLRNTTIARLPSVIRACKSDVLREKTIPIILELQNYNEHNANPCSGLSFATVSNASHTFLLHFHT